MQLGQVFADRYRLEDRLGAGAFGVVFSAFDEGLLQRRVAVKLLAGASEAAPPDPARAARFISELRLAGALRHPHIAAVHDAGLWNGQLYMVQELVDGVDLGRFLAEHGPISVELALALAGAMLDAVAYAHEQGVLHRDLKPGNLLIDRAHRLVVVDFGLATSTGLPGEARAPISGTPGYAAPEQVRGGGDARADQFSLGAVIYLLLTGVTPFVGKNLPETLRRTLLSDPEPPSRIRPEIPPGVDRAVMRALSKRPDDRYPSLRAFAHELAAHAAFEALASPGDRRAALADAAARGALVLVAGPEHGDWLAELRLPLAVVLGPVRLPAGAEGGVLTDPREEIYPSAEGPVLLSLVGDEASLGQASDGLRAALVNSSLLVLGLSPDDPALRRLLAHVRAWAPAGRVPVFAVAPRWSLDEVRAAERRGVLLLEQPMERTRAELSAELPRPAAAPTARLPSRPYKFLSYFEDGDEPIFFGRDVEVARLMARVLAWPVALLYGASGAGKTSIIRAALAPRLARAGHRVILARVFDDPLAEVCRSAGLDPNPPEGRAGRLAALARAGRLAVVFLDQLEELWSRFPRPARERVARELAEALALSGGHLRLVLCLRADHLALLSEWKEILPISLERGLYLESLSGAAARAAVVEPAALLGVSVEGALMDQMLADLGDEGVDPPQLQLICDALWEARDPAEPALTRAAYQALGEARSILARHLNRALDGLAPAERDRAAEVLKAMVTASDTRSVRRLADIARVSGLGEAAARAQLDALADLRLVRPMERPDGVWYELTHEVLAAEIGRWLSEEDRRVQQVRELLEQGCRGYDQLGLLLSPAQLALVAQFENRLSLNEKERSLIARSRAAESFSRRRALSVGALALALIVGGRALWLSQLRFARANEQHLSWTVWDEPVEAEIAPIVVYRGAADPWWVDGLLGYPRDAYETDLELGDLRPTLRDALRRGVDLPRGARADLWLSEQLTHTAAAKARFLAGDLAEVGAALGALAADPGSGPEEVLSLGPVLALGEAAPDGAVEPTLRALVARVTALRVPGGDRPLSDEIGAPLGLLLNRVPRARWSAQVDALLEATGGPELVGRVLEVSGPPESMAALASHLGDADGPNVESAVRAVSASGACAWLPEVRAVVAGPQRAVPLEQIVRPYLDLVRVCGGADDLPALRDLLVRALNGELKVRWSFDVLHTIYLLDPGLARALLAEAAPGLRGAREVTVVPWAYLEASEMLALLDPEGPEVLQGRVYRGDPSAVWSALAYGLADPSDPSRAAWLWPLALYQGAPLERRVIGLLEGGGLPVAQALPLQAVAARRGDAAAARAAGRGLSSADLLPVQTALNQLSAMRAPLADLGLPGRQAALGLGVVALRRGEATEVDFLGVLGDPAATALERMLAVEGQRRRWLTGPAQPALAALRSPLRQVRLAAILALAARADPPPVDSGEDPWLTLTLERLRWTRRALQEDARLREQIRAALTAGQPRRARQLVRLLRSGSGVAATVEAVLAPALPGVYPAEIEDEAVYLGALADLRSGTPATTEWLIAYVPPLLWSRYAAEPELADRQRLYSVSVLSGTTPALTVEEP